MSVRYSVFVIRKIKSNPASGKDEGMEKFFRSYEESWKLSAKDMIEMFGVIKEMPSKRTQKMVDLQIAYSSIQEMCKVSIGMS